MIRKFLGIKINTIAAAALVVSVSSLVSRLLGILRDRLLAGQFGAGDSLDVYYAAFRLPDFIFNLIVLGALSAGFIPVFSKLLLSEKDKQSESWLLVNNVMNLVGLALLIISMLAIAFASPLAKIISPGFDLEKQAAVATLTRIMFISPLLLGLSSVVSGVLQSYKSFIAYSFSPLMYNLGIIFGILYLVPIFGITGLAWGVVIGACLHLLIQLPPLYYLGFKYQFYLNLKNAHLIQILKMMVPRTLSLAVSQLNLLASTAIASTLITGSLAIFNFANNLQFFPIGIFAISFATAAFPTLSRHANDDEKLSLYFSRVSSQILFFIIPSAVFLFVIKNNLTHVILGGGLFSERDLQITNSVFSIFLISLFAQALIPLLVRVFYARENSRTPLYISLFAVLIDISFSLILSKIYGVFGIAMAFTISSIVNFICLVVVLKIQLKVLNGYYILTSAYKALVASILAGLLMFYVLNFLNNIVNYLIAGTIAAMIGAVLYLFITYLLKSRECVAIIFNIRSKILKK